MEAENAVHLCSLPLALAARHSDKYQNLKGSFIAYQ